MHEHREAEDLVVQAHQQHTQPFAQRQAQQPAAGDHGGDQLEVVQGDGAVGVAQRLERRDLLALGRDQPRRDHMQQEGGHRQEDRGQHRAQHLLLADLVVQHGVRHLVVAAVRRQSAERGELPASPHRRSPARDVPGASLIATRLNAPCMSSAAASSSASSQNTPKARTSGMPHMPAKMYSGDSTVPVMRRRRSLPLTSAVTWEPGVSLWACAKTSVTAASSSPPARVPGSGRRPERSDTRFRRCGWRVSSPISWPITGSVLSGTVTRAPASTVVWTSTTPGSSASRRACASGARLTLAKTSAKRPIS